MIDSEKVVKGLECCASNRMRREDCEAMDCAYLDLEEKGCIHQLIRDALALLKAQSTVDGWINVKDRLPDEKENWITKDYQKVICCCDFGGDPQRIDVRTYGFGNGHFWHGPQIMDGVVTHWMPLPEPPKEDNDAEQ